MYNKRNLGVRSNRNFNQYVNPRYAPENIGKKGKGRYWVWIIVSFTFTIFIGIVSQFFQRCRTALVFSSTSFKVAALFFIVFIFGSFQCLIKVRIHKDHYVYYIWHQNRFFAITTIVSAMAAIGFFTYAIWPAYQEASIVFTVMGSLFLTNLGCLILYD